MAHRPRSTAAESARIEARIRALALAGKRQKEICFEVDRSDKHVSVTLRQKLGLERVYLTAEERQLIAARRKEAGIECAI